MATRKNAGGEGFKKNKMARLIGLALILLLPAFAFSQEKTKADLEGPPAASDVVYPSEEVSNDSSSSPSDLEEEATVEALMKKKLNLLEQAEKIERIEAAVSQKLPSDTSEEKILKKPGYQPLKDEDGKLVQKEPPFSIKRENP